MSLAHFGLGIFIIGLAFTSNYTIEKDLRMSAGDSYQIGDYTYRFDGVSDRRGPNYLSQTGTITVLKGARTAAVLKPEKRVYLVQRMPMTEAGIDAELSKTMLVEESVNAPSRVSVISPATVPPQSPSPQPAADSSSAGPIE